MTPTTEQPAKTPPVFTDKLPEFPFLMYNAETRTTKPAKDKEEKDKLAGEGFSEDPYPAEDPDALTPAEVAELQKLLAKAAKALAKLGKESEKPAQEGEPANQPA
ncbi:MAG TPA: hypothetical protein VGG62_10545 [Terracidiphilus sp.]|jgi:hypothetical protein